MVTESELAKRVQEFLLGSDLKKITNNIIIKKLESEFGIDLSDRKPFLRNQVDRFLQSQYEVSEGDDYRAEIYRENGVNDDVFDSDDGGGDGDDDEFYNAVPKPGLTVRINNNNGISFKLKGIKKFDRLVKPKKEKRICFSGKFCTLSPELQKFLGVPHMTRTEIVKYLWTYVKEKSLQDPNDGKSIICDETLRDLFGVDSINILQIHKALTKHIWPRVKPVKRDKQQKHEIEEKAQEAKSVPEDKPRKQEREEVKSLKRDKQQKQENDEEASEVKLVLKGNPQKQEREEVKPLKRDKQQNQEKEEEAPEVKLVAKDNPRKQEREEDQCGDETYGKRQKKVVSGFLAPLPLSDTLIRFLGTGEIALSRADVIKRVWEYIKHKELQDPSDKKIIICDEKMKELLNVESFHGFTVSKLLSPHFAKL